MRLSIIIPMYNAEKYIVSCLDSIIAQGLNKEDYEIIIINDGSSDNSKLIVEQYMTKAPNIRLYSQVNKGQSSARNHGLDISTGEYILFVDADDFLLPDSLRPIISYIESSHSRDNDMVIFGITGGLPENAKISEGSGKCIWEGSGYEYIASHNYNNSPCYYLLSRTYADKINLRFIEDKLCEDGMFTLTALLHARHIVYIDKIVYYYAVRPNSTTTTTDPRRIKKITEGFEYAIDYFGKMIDTHDKMGDGCLKRVVSRRDSYIFFLLCRLLKYGATTQASRVIASLAQKKLYPIRNLIGNDYSGLKISLLLYLLNSKPMYLTACKLVELKNRIQA